jgi:hypothetical protein
MFTRFEIRVIYIECPKHYFEFKKNNDINLEYLEL